MFDYMEGVAPVSARRTPTDSEIVRGAEVGRVEHRFDAKKLEYRPRLGTIALTLFNGNRVEIKIENIPELRDVRRAVLRTMRLGPQGEAIEIRPCDLDISVVGLIRQAVGVAAWLSRGGRARTTAKTAAARRNGRRGGRPRKLPSNAG
jgi:hypothetical protein